jgi:sec-independent protein translocase protein TatA
VNLPSGWELILVLLVVVLVFGSKRLPDSARSLGRSMRILKAETKGLRDDDDAAAGPQTTAHVVTPVAGPAPVAPPTPVVGEPAPQPFVGQQLFDANGRPVLFDAQGRPVQAPVNGSAPEQAAQAPRPQA